MKNNKELSSDSDFEKRQRKWQNQRQQKGNKKPKKRGQSNGNGNGNGTDSDDDFVSTKKVYNSPPKLPNVAAVGRRKNPKKPPVSSNGNDSDDDFVSTKKVYNSPPKLPNVAAVGRRKNVIPKKPPVSSNVNVNVVDSPPKLPNVAAAPKKPPVSSAALNAALQNATTKDRSSSPSNATAASVPAINITSHRNTTSSIIGSGRTGSTQEVAHPLPIRQSPPPIEYGSEWDTDGEATIAQLKQMQRKRPSKKAHSTSTKPEVKQTPVQSNRKRAASTDEASDADEATTKRSTATKRSKASKRSKVTKTQQDSADEAGDSDEATTKRSTATKRSKASKRSKATKTQQDSADEAGDSDEATTKRSTSTKRSKASKAQQRKDDDENGNRAVITTQLKEITFLGNVFDKSIRRFTCPFDNCDVNYSSFLHLKNHVKDTHEETLQKPIETDTNNWRRIQNANHRFDITTVKQKLRPLIIDGETIIKKHRVREPLATEKTEVATKVFDIMNKQAVELSKLAILFSSLVYFDVYNTISNPENGNKIDGIFEEEFNWKEMILEFKQFQRNTAKAKKPRPDKHDAFFDLCRKYHVETYFTETSQNAWNSIVDTFATNFKTNITTHLYSRIRKWFAFKLRDGKKKKDIYGKENRKDINNKIYHTMKFLFDSEKCTQAEEVQHELICELQKICQFPNFNHGGRSYFERLRYDFKEDGDDDLGKPKRKRKCAAPKKTTKKSKKKKKKTQNNGPRLNWFQMVPAMVRLQRRIYEINLSRKQTLIDAGIIKVKKKRKRKRKRKRKNESKPEPSSTQKNKRQAGGTKKKYEIDPEATHHAKLPNFIVVPQNSFHTMHYPIDTKALFDIVKNLPQFKAILNQAEFLELQIDDDPNRKTTNPFWYFLFNIQKMETATKKFGGRITTNGSDVSIQYCKLRKEKELTKAEILEMASNRKRKHDVIDSDSESESEDDDDDDDDAKTKKTDPAIVSALTNITNMEVLSVSGVDLGVRNVAATVIRKWSKSSDGYDVHESNVLHKSKDYHYKAGFARRQRKGKKLHGEFDERYQKDRQSKPEEPSKKSPDYIKFLTSRLKWFNEGTDTYMQRVVTNVKFDKFRSTQKQMMAMAKEIVGDINVHGEATTQQSKVRVVFVGNCSTPANSTIKGHRRSPGNAPIVRYLKQIPQTYVDATIDEYCTTKKCSRCYETLDGVEFSKERLKLCHNCKLAENSTSTNLVSTYQRKKVIAEAMIPIIADYPKPTQFQRAQRVAMDRTKRWSSGDKMRMAERNKLKSTTYTVNKTATLKHLYWNRDGNAARNIMQLGLCQYNDCLPIEFNRDEAFQRPKKKD